MRKILSSLAEGVLANRSPGLLLIFCALWLCMTAGIRPLMLPDEGRYVGVAWEMLTSGNWLVPTLDGLPFFHKPPLFYWLTALALKLFGGNEWAARLASMLAAVLAAGALHLFLRRQADKRLANLAVVVLVTQPLFFAAAQFANLDLLVAAMISLTILAGADAVLSLERGLPHRIALASTYIFAALGVLAKGLIGLLLPGAVLFVWLLLGKRFRLIPALLPLRLIALFLVLATPWFWWMEKSYPGFWDYFFVYHHFRRFAETGFNNQLPFWFYVPVLLVGTLPWSPWIYRACSRHFLIGGERFAIRSLMIIWLSVILVFFSLPSSKLVGYILPTLPPMAYLIADVLLIWLPGTRRADAAAWPGLCLVVAGTACLSLVLLVARLDHGSSRSLVDQVLPMFHTDDQIVMIEDYQYDLPFYLRARKHPWVVSDWRDPDLPAKDNWRKELYDAGQFDPVNRQEYLVLPGEFTARLCGYSGGALWLWGKNRLSSQYPFLQDQAVVFSDGKRSLWRLDAASRRTLKPCAETPSSG
ncbi:Glycosyl transferase family 39 [Candidatus Accumulibacter aalborgensis]|uniref:Glycosyl transferase family 39 n=1 Tax=Candidatus Accumulibacter aalborgensis TaxID=1860102 RepID=A0A1A8XEN3_9PROT|nr:glycosyltransferase family 39 protein [Candidatus Accumulibacter aalborgensis]SBT03649.1 Glycosyl transferase family 39 [Candidatus Accumulibacter aalborgensis]